MAGRGPAPDPQRVRRGKPARGDWSPSPDGGWQHDLPEPPPGLLSASVTVWEGWFKAWWAGNWTQDDVPQLRLVIRLWDRVHRGDIKRLAELRQLMDSFGLTPKGQMDRRWERPKPIKTQVVGGSSGRWDHLRQPQGVYGHLRHPSAKERLAAIEEQQRLRPSERFDRIQEDERRRRLRALDPDLA
jgi:hypothetical protein